MSSRAAVTLTIYSMLAATNVWSQSIQNFYGRPIAFSSQSYSAQHANIVGFDNQNRPFPHSVNNFNPLSSSLVSSSQSFFYPGFSNRQQYTPSASFGRPLPINQFHGRRVPRIPSAQSSGLSFTDNRNQQGGSLNAGAITFGRPVHTPISFSNKPTQSVLPSHHTSVPHVSIAFGDGPVVFPGTSSSNKGSPSVGLPAGATKPAGDASVTELNITNINEDENCMLKHGVVYFGGSCEILLSASTCPEDHWLLLDVYGSPYCAKRQCPWGQLNHFGNCVDPGDPQVCNRGQILYVDLTGFVECDCEPEFVFHSASGNCYGIHEQGFCDAALYLERDNQGNVVCVPNPCITDKYVEQDGVCHEKNYRGYCKQELVKILPQVVTADCQFLVPHSILEVSNLTACPNGSQRALLGQCRGVLRVASQSTFPPSKGDCPANFVKDPRGVCRKVITLFG